MGCVWYYSLMGMDAPVGRYDVVHTFCLPSDYCVPGLYTVVVGHRISSTQSIGIVET